MDDIKIIIDESTLTEYEDYYFAHHPKAKKKPIAHPYHESINVWMIMKRAMMNALKQKWKDFITWFVEAKGYANLRIEECDMIFTAWYPNNRRHDVDNSVPKFILDGFVQGGFIVDDDCNHVHSLLLKCGSDIEHPRTEIEIMNIKLTEGGLSDGESKL